MSPFRLLRIVRQRLRDVSAPETLEVDIDRELAFHLDQLTAEYVADGMGPAEARLAAKRTLGNLPLVAEDVRDSRGVAWLHDFRRDVSHGMRMLLRRPMASCVIVASLALGIGANTAVLAAIDAIVQAPLLIQDPDRVLVIGTARTESPQNGSPVTIADYLAWSDQQQSFESMALTLGNQADFSVSDEASAERVQGVAATASLFSVLRVSPARGRLYSDDEAVRVQPRLPVVLSHRLWLSHFGGKADVVGTSFRINRREAYIVGVMPEGFHFPNENIEYWVPAIVDRSAVQSPQRVYGVTGRLKPDASVGQAEADLNRISTQLAIERPDRHDGWIARVTPVREQMYGWTREPLWTLEAAVALVLLVGCTNVAGLLLARAVARRSEIGVRAALGASRARLVRQLMTETIVHAAAGGVFGVALAAVALRLFAWLTPPPGAMAMVDVTLNGRVLALAAVVSLASALLFGTVPALAGSRWDVSESRRTRWREALVGAQIAVTLVLLVGAGLLTRSFLAVVTSDVGFNADRILTFQVGMPIGEFTTRRGAVGDRPYFDIGPAPAQLFERLHERLRAVPGVQAVGGSWAPVVNALIVPSTTAGAGNQTVNAAYFVVTPGFMRAIDARLVRGRDLEDGDTPSTSWVAVVNETAARVLWRGADPLGQELLLSEMPDERPRQVVGIVADIPLAVPAEAPRPVIYLSYRQQPDRYPLPGANLLGQMVFLVRAAGDPLALLPSVRGAVGEIDRRRPLANVGTMDEQLRARMPQRADFLLIIGAFAVAALLLAAIGIYGIVSYTAAMRTREIGVRMALGARGVDVVHLVGRRAAIVAALGVAMGVSGAPGFTRLLRSQLWNVARPIRPPTSRCRRCSSSCAPRPARCRHAGRRPSIPPSPSATNRTSGRLKAAPTRAGNRL